MVHRDQEGRGSSSIEAVNHRRDATPNAGASFQCSTESKDRILKRKLFDEDAWMSVLQMGNINLSDKIYTKNGLIQIFFKFS